MATFLLIHGAWHDGWAFERIAPLLMAAGHRVLTPDLPVKGKRCSLGGWGRFVAGLAQQQGEPVILCGHSRGGIVISDAAERAPDAVGALVYISGFLVPNGRSMDDEVADWPRHPAFEAGLQPMPQDGAVALTAEAAAELFYQLSPREDADRMTARLIAEPVLPMAQKLKLTPERFGSVPRHYIECTDDRALSLAHQRAMQAALPCVSVTTLESDHSPFLSCPDALARALVAIADDSRSTLL